MGDSRQGPAQAIPRPDGPVHAVNGIDLEIRPGECFGLLGPNGAGKTTTVEILEGLNQPTSGEVEVLGLRWATDETAIRERIGVTLQETRFPDKETVREIVTALPELLPRRAEPRRGDRAGRRSRARRTPSSSSSPAASSSGWPSRCRLVGDPELLFLDEPTTGSTRSRAGSSGT